ncbi:MAG: uroporphyrinogen decarboxylase family protein [Armatimonadota bacterium]
MQQIQRADRFAKSQERIRAAFEMRDPVDPPIIVWPLHYIVFGTPADQVPHDMFSHPQRVMDFQTRLCEQHLNAVDDDFQPYLVPYSGTCVLGSAFGLKVDFHPGRDPSPGHPFIKTPADVMKLKLPDPERDGLMPRILEMAACMRDQGDYPVSLTDTQSPLDELILMVGHEQLYVWMYEEPQLVHDLFDLATEALIAWVKAQKAVTEEPMDVCYGEQGVWIPPPCGVWLADDEAVNLPVYLYEEFVAPRYSRIFKEFGGGVLHFCGRGFHLGEVVTRIEGLRAVNSGPMGNPVNTMKLQASLKGQVPLIYQEIAPIDAENYYRDLLGQVSMQGLILAPQVCDLVASAPNGAFVDVNQNRVEAAQKLHHTLQKLVHEKISTD